MKKAGLIGFVIIFSLVLFEGVSSLFLTIYDSLYAYRNFGQAEGSGTETQFDAALGWVNTPNMEIPGKYGPGKNLTINQQGMRHSSDIPAEKPQGFLRVVMVGDSFVFGSENGDNDTLAANVERLCPHVECINMGVPGYGMDQAYLHYKKNGQGLNADIVLFCVIPTDFDRASRSRYRSGYNKPFIQIVRNELRVTNVPVPDPLPHRSSLFTRKEAVIWGLHRMAVSKLMKKALKAFGFDPDPVQRGIDHGFAILPYILSDLQSDQSSSPARIVVVSLPLYQDYHGGAFSAHAMAFNDRIRSVCESQNTDFVDLRETFVSLSDTSRKDFFHSDWHYNELGAQRVAANLVSNLPDVAITCADIDVSPAVRVSDAHGNRLVVDRPPEAE